MKKLLTIILLAFIIPVISIANVESSDNDLTDISIKENLINELLENIKKEDNINGELTDAQKEAEVKENIFQKGIASFYGERWNGRKTANGETFNTEKISAAHKTLPFGTKVKVTNLSNDKSVVVVINDRGPYIKGRIIDLSKAAFRKIEDINKGITKVKLEILE